MSDPIKVIEAAEADVPAIRAIFQATYGEDYPYQFFYDEGWLKHSVFNNDILMLVARDGATDEVLGTSSVVLDVGAYTDLIGEFGRLAVLPSARGRGVGKALMQARVDFVQDRLHVGVVENRCTHPFSQRISHAFGFAPVGFLAIKHRFIQRESVALFCRHFGDALSLRRNNPRVVPEVHALAHIAMHNCGLTCDVVVDEEAAPYPGGTAFDIQELTARGLPALLRIERGRVRRREIFGPMRLQYGFFKLTARHATYLIAREAGQAQGAVAGAIGFIHDDIERGVRLFELISRSDHAIRPLMSALLVRCAELGIEYVEADVSAHATRMQRTLVELGFVPAAYVPAMVFYEVERLDTVKMIRLLVPPDVGEMQLTEDTQAVADVVMGALKRQSVLPRIAEAVDRISLFNGLTIEQRERIAGACDVANFSAGEALFRMGDTADSMLMLLCGQVSVRRSDSQHLGHVHAGESVGERSLLTGDRRSADVLAETEVTAASLNRDALTALTRQRPDIAVVLYRNLAIGLGRKLKKLNAALASGE